ncbi:MAG: hypothetical protein GWN58_59940 [Anaerolineae bacterium]|nr:hypothetical protein [Anaerolineae bacterium]
MTISLAGLAIYTLGLVALLLVIWVRIRRDQRKLEELREALAQLEWVPTPGPDGERLYCRACYNYKEHGHDEDCIFRILEDS